MESKTNYPTSAPELNNTVNIDSVISQLVSLTSDEALKDLLIRNKLFLENAALKKEIEWIDFYSNYLEFDEIRSRNQEIKDAKTKYITFDIAALQEYLTRLTNSGYSNVEVYIGKYRNAEDQPSGEPIPESHQKKITVMFAAEGTAFKFRDDPKPWNVGDPHP